MNQKTPKITSQASLDTDWFPWSDAFATGIPKIDREHRLIFKHLSELAMAELNGRRSTKQLVSRVLRTVRSHLKSEQILWESSLGEHPWVKHHAAQHEVLRDRLTADLQDAHFSGTNSSEVLVELVKWQAEHILSEDLRMAQAVRLVREGLDPADACDKAGMEKTKSHPAMTSSLLTLLGSSLSNTLSAASARRDQLLAQQLLTEQQAHLFRRAFDLSASAIVIVDAVAEDFPIIYINAAFSRLTGYSVEDCVGKNCRFLHLSDCDQPDLKNIRKALRKGTSMRATLRNYRKDGTLFWNHLAIAPLHDKENKLTHYVGIQTDISKLKKLEEQAQQERDLAEKREAILKQAQLLAKAGHWEYVAASNTLTWSDEVYKIFGLDPQSFPATYEGFLATVHPNDLEAVKVAFDTHLITQQPYYIQHRIVLPDGGIKHVQERCESTFDKEGRPLRSLGVVLDVTEAYDQEQEFRRLFEGMAQGVVYQDATGAITQANPAAIGLLGLEYEQLTGRTSTDPKWRAIREDGAEFPGDEHPAMVALRTGRPVTDVVMGVYHPRRDETVWILINAQPEFRAGQNRPWRVFTTFTDISEIKRNKAALQESEMRNRAIFSAIEDIIFIIDQDGAILDCPVDSDDQLYVPKSEFLGRRILETLPQDVAGLLMEAIGMCLRDGTPQKVEYVLPVANQACWFEASITAMGEKRVLSVVRDITSRKIIENELRDQRQALENQVAQRTAMLKEQEQFYRGLVESQQDLIVRVDRNNCFTFVNDAYCRFFGKTRGQLVGRSIFPHIHQDDIALTLAGIKQLENPPHRVSIEHRAPADTGIRWIAWEGCAIWDEAGYYREFQAVGRDITQSKAAQEAAEAASRAKTEFLAKMSHEIRTPLNAIMGFAKMLARELPTGSRQAGHAQTLLQSSEHLIAMTNDLLEVGRIDSGNVVLIVDRFNLSVLLREMADVFRVRAGEKGLHFVFEPIGNLSVTVRADQTKLRQIIFNLLDNALKFTDAGRVLFRARLDARQVAGTAVPTISVEVEDTGCGIATEEMPCLFDDFFQGDTGKAFGGTGLGLPICQKLLRLMGGDIGVQSEKGAGTVVRFTLPVVPVEEENKDHSPAPEGATASLPGIQPRTPPSLEEIARLPQELCRAMHEAVRDGNMAAMRSHLEQLRNSQPRLADGLRLLTDRYDYETLEAILNATGKKH